jgi:RNA polymerase primary sigma factor
MVVGWLHFIRNLLNDAPTQYMNDKEYIDRYLQKLLAMDIPKLTMQQEHDLAKKIAEGDDDALEELVKHNLRFVVYVLSKTSAWHHSKITQEDIIAIGNEALFMAGRTWKPTNNARFATYAKPFIERGVRRELDNTANIIRLPVNVMQQIKKLSVTEKGLTQVLNRKPKISEIAQVMQVPESKIHQLKGYIKREPLSLDSVNNQHLDEGSDD